MIPRKRERNISLDIELSSTSSSSKKGKLNTDDVEVINIPTYKTKIAKREYYNLTGKNYRFIFPLELTSIYESAFSLTFIKELNLPSKLKYIGVDAFSSNNLLVNVVIPNSVETIGRSAFADNQQLLDVRFGSESKLKVLGVEAFAECRLLRNVVLPPNLKTIDSFAFSQTNLQSIVVYADKLEFGVFSKCYNLREVVIRKSKRNTMFTSVQVVSNIFLLCNSLKKLILPDDVLFLQYAPIPSCREVVWVISQTEFGCGYRKDLVRNKAFTYTSLPKNVKHTIVCEYQLENLEYLLLSSKHIDVHNWEYLSMMVYEYLEDIL